MEREREGDRDRDGWTHSRGIRATINNMRRDARDRAGWRGAATTVARSRMRPTAQYEDDSSALLLLRRRYRNNDI